jgi:hypothetical protein
VLEEGVSDSSDADDNHGTERRGLQADDSAQRARMHKEAGPPSEEKAKQGAAGKRSRLIDFRTARAHA